MPLEVLLGESYSLTRLRPQRIIFEGVSSALLMRELELLPGLMIGAVLFYCRHIVITGLSA